MGPGPDVFHHLIAIDLSAFDSHPRIVESPAAAEQAPYVKLLWHDEHATQAFAQALAQLAPLQQAFIALHGNLGAGKTTLVRHLLQALGVTGRIKSPTYAVVEPYELPQLAIWHFDFYRFGDPREWEDAGFRDIFASPGLKLAEWPEKAAPMLPTPDWDLHLHTRPDESRQVRIFAHTALGQALLQGLKLAEVPS